jgi:hypothetical protein
VLHLGHFPFAILVPLEVVLSTGSFMSTFALHFTQYPCVAIFNLLVVYLKKRFSLLLNVYIIDIHGKVIKTTDSS